MPADAVAAVLRQIEALESAIPGLVRTLHEEQDWPGLARLYWGAASVSVATLDIPDRNKKRMRAETEPIWAAIAQAAPKYECPGCQAVELSFTSRSHRSIYQTQQSKGLLSSDKSYFCAPCRQAHEAANSARADEFDAERRAEKARMRELAAMPYREYLRSPEWQDVRQRHLKAAQYRCQLCNKGGLLDVHHRSYANRGKEYFNWWRDKNLIVLCRSCHARFHDRASTGGAS